MLNVTPDATASEIRVAYRALAQRHHPDKHPEGARRRAAAEHMSQINAAWAVLGNESKRRAYDRTRSTESHVQASAAKSQPSAFVPVDDDVVINFGHDFDSSVDIFSDAERVRMPIAMAGFIPAIALALALLAIFIFTAYAGGPSQQNTPEHPNENMVAIRDLRGQCIQQSNGFILVVNCALTPNEGRIVAQASLGAPCPAGTQGWIVRQQQVQACVDPATAVP